MTGLRLFFDLKLCDATDCVNNHLLKVGNIEKNIVFHFDIQLIKNKLKPYFLPRKTSIDDVTHIQYMDELGIICFAPFTMDTVTTMPCPMVNFRLLSRNRKIFGFEIYGSKKPYFYENIEEVELYHDHLDKNPIITLW